MISRAALVLAGCCLMAQEPAALRTTARLVVAPVTVNDGAGKPVHGLTKGDFRLFDNGKAREFDVELLEQPVSLVVAIQTDSSSVAALAKLKKVSSLFAPVVAGARGGVAIVTFADEVRLAQEFSASPEIGLLKARGGGAKLLDAVDEGVRLLTARPKSHRRVVLLISGAKDRGSGVALTEVFKRAQEASVTVFPITFSAAATQFSSRDVPTSGPDSAVGGSILAMLGELGRLGKEDTAEALARETGGLRLRFTRQNALEEAMSKIGEEIHTQYLLAFQPVNAEGEEYRAIRVELPGRPELRLRTRPGYWITPAP